MTTLVCGGAGFLGSHTVLGLLDRGHVPVVVDDLSTGSWASVPAQAAFVEADVGDVEAVVSICREYGVRSIIHFASMADIRASVAAPTAAFRSIVDGTRAVIDAAVKAGVREIVFASSAAVYGETDQTRIRETAPLQPCSPLGAAMMAAEWMLHQSAQAHGVRYVVVRGFNASGADPHMRSGPCSAAGGLIRAAVRAALGLSDGLKIFGMDFDTHDGTAVRDYVHIADLADVHVSALQYLHDGGRNLTVNCGYGREVSVMDVVATVERVCGARIPYIRQPYSAADPARLVADTTDLRRYLSWSPRHDDLELVIAHAVEWERMTAFLPIRSTSNHPSFRTGLSLHT